MSKSTQRIAYLTIKDSELLSQRRFEVYEALYENGPSTTGEIWKKFFKRRGISQNSVNPRLSELVKCGVVEEAGKKECSVTGFTCTVWQVNDKLPKYEKKKKT